MNAEQMAGDIAALVDIPKYKAEAILKYLGKVIYSECKVGGSVEVPMLGKFYNKRVAPKRLNNMIAGNAADGTRYRQTINLPARRKLHFLPLDSKKWFI